MPSKMQVSFKYGGYDVIVDKSMNVDWQNMVESNSLVCAKDCYNEYDASKVFGGMGSPIVIGVMAFVMGIVTMIRVTRNVPRKATNANVYPGLVYCDDAPVDAQAQQATTTPGVSTEDYMAVLKRMAELEDKVCVLSQKPVSMPPEKEELLDAAMSRVAALEEELASTKKARRIHFHDKRNLWEEEE